MRNTEKNLKVSCTECIHRRRILTCHENGRDCTLCKNACCCRKCNPDASGQELDYEQRKYFSPGMPMSEYVQLKKEKQQAASKAISSEIDNIKYETTEQVNIVEQEIVEPTNRNIKKKNNIKKSPAQQEKQDVADNLTTDKNGQLSFLWD